MSYQGIAMTSTVAATLSYFTPPGGNSKPYIEDRIDPSTGQQAKNWSPVERHVDIENIRGKEDEYTLDTAGFQVSYGEAKHKAFTDDKDVRDEYYPETIELVKRLTGANSVMVFDHTIRRRRPDEKEDSPDKRQPVPLVHVDQTTQSAVNRVHRHVTATDVSRRLQGRFQIINVWRPIDHSADEWPLAFCDYRSVDPQTDFVPTELRNKAYTGETMSVKYNPNHKWKYVRGLKPDEFALIKCFDSKEGVAAFTPHTAFDDPSTPSNAPFRESIEVRTLVFYD